MKIFVTSEHIKRGKRGSDCECPVAIALSEYFGKTSVSDLMLLILRTNKVIKTPPIVVDFIAKFDDNEDVKPFEFDIE